MTDLLVPDVRSVGNYGGGSEGPLRPAMRCPPPLAGPSSMEPREWGRVSDVDYTIAHGGSCSSSAPVVRKESSFLLVTSSGNFEADGPYQPGSREWNGFPVHENHFTACIVSREAQVSQKTGAVKHGFVLGKDGQPWYGAKTEDVKIPSEGWRVLKGLEPAPSVKVYKTWCEATQAAAWHYAKAAAKAVEASNWSGALLLSDRAFACHMLARPKGRGDGRYGGGDWSEELCEILSARSDILLHMGEYQRALVDAVAAVHFVAAFDWSRARTRGVAACLNLGVAEDQAKLLMEEACRRDWREFPGIRDLAPWVTMMLEKARKGRLRHMQVESRIVDDGRLFYRVVDLDDCSVYSRPDFRSTVIGSREYNDLVRGERVLEGGLWLELHVSEEWEVENGWTKAFMPLFAEATGGIDSEPVLETCPQQDKPKRPIWEKMGFSLKPCGLKPPPDGRAQDYGVWRDPQRHGAQQEWPYIYKHGLAIGAFSIGRTEDVLDSFLRYHWGIGFNHIFLCFDDPDDPGIEVAKFFEESIASKKIEGIGLSIHILTSDWWESTRSRSRFFQRRDRSDRYDNVCKSFEKHNDMESRHLIALDIMIQDAWKMGIDWFASLEVDECIYVPKQQENSARRYFGSRSRTHECIRLWNHEAVPENMECKDWFRESTCFMLSPFHCEGCIPPREYDQQLRKREGRECEAAEANPKFAWFSKIMGSIVQLRQRMVRKLCIDLGPCADGPLNCPAAFGRQTNLGSCNETGMMEAFPYFSSYTCGKCAVHLNPATAPPLPDGLFGFVADSGHLLKDVHQATDANDAVVLHYPYASLAQWKHRFERLGRLPPGGEERPSSTRTHIASSYMVHSRPSRDQDFFYKSFIMQSELNELPYMAEHGLVIRLSGVKELLERFDTATDAEEVLPGRIELVAPNGLKFGKPKARMV